MSAKRDLLRRLYEGRSCRRGTEPPPPMIYLGAPCFIPRTLTLGVVCI